jgi:hypothetical protein
MRASPLSLLLVGCAAACSGPAPVSNAAVAQVAEVSAMSGWAVNYPGQRKVFEAAGRLWLFYVDGSDALVRTSIDGITWGDAALVRHEATFGHRIAYWYDGRNIHYAHCNAEQDDPVVYRRGILKTDGTIAWPTAEQTVFTPPAGLNVMYPKVIVDSAGQPWVAFMLYDGGFSTAPYDAIVTHSATSDGTWSTATGFPFTLVSQNTTAYPDPLGVALTGEKTYWLYNRNNPDDTYYGRLWNGDAWEAEERATVSHSEYGLYNMVTDGDVIHLAFAGGILRYRQRDAEGSWQSEETISGGASGHASIARAGPNDVIVTWLDEGANQVLIRRRTGGTWAPPGVIADESQDKLANPELAINLNGLVDASGRFLVAAPYTTGANGSYTVKIATVPRN